MDLEKTKLYARNAHIKPDDIIVYMDDDDYYPSERVS